MLYYVMLLSYTSLIETRGGLGREKQDTDIRQMKQKLCSPQNKQTNKNQPLCSPKFELQEILIYF